MGSRLKRWGHLVTTNQGQATPQQRTVQFSTQIQGTKPPVFMAPGCQGHIGPEQKDHLQQCSTTDK